MKKIFLALALVGLAGGSTFAQTTADLSISPLVSPAIGEALPNLNSGDSIVFSAYVKNNGPDVILPTDTLVFYLQGNGIATDGVDDYVLNGAVFGGDTLAVGDSALVGISILQGDNYGNSSNGPVVTAFPHNAADTFLVWVVGFDATGTPFTDDGINNGGSYPQPSDANSNNLTGTAVTFGTPTGIHQVAGDNASLSVYPNPASNNINVKYNFANASSATIRVMDMFGRTLMTQDLGKQSGEQTVSISTATLAQGMYILEMSTDNARSTTRFSIVK